MRILLLTQFYPPVLGGEERHVRDLGATLAARGHEVAIATLRQAGAPDRELDGDRRVYRLPATVQRAAWLFQEPGRRQVPPGPDPEAVLALRRVIARERPTVVHAHNWLVHSFLPLKVWSGAKLVVTLHDYSLACAKKSLMYRDDRPCTGPAPRKCGACAGAHYGPAKGIATLLGTWTLGAAERVAVDMFLPVSRAVAVGNGLVGGRWPYTVIPNFVPDVIAAAGDDEPRLAQLPREPYLLFVGDLRGHKGVDVLLRAYAALGDAPPLVLIGRACPDTPAALPSNVTMLHDWPHRAVMAAWRRSLLGVVPSVCPDSCPTVAMEAMATGRAVVASRIGGLPDLVDDGETGLLVPPGDPQALGGALARLLADAGLRGRMGETARRKVRAFQASNVVTRIEGVYGDLLRDARPGMSASTPS